MVESFMEVLKYKEEAQMMLMAIVVLPSIARLVIACISVVVRTVVIFT